MEWLALAFACMLYSFCAYLSYNDKMRDEWYYVPLCIFMGTIVSTIWFITCRYLDDKQRIYVYSLFWDLMMGGVYYFMPLLFFGVRIDRWSLFGLFMVVAGLTIIKVRA